LLQKRKAEHQLFAEVKRGRSGSPKKTTRLKKDVYSRSRLQGLLLQKEIVKSV
jgi:hypothetical protein